MISQIFKYASKALTARQFGRGGVKMNIKIFSGPRLVAAIALLMLTCGAPSHAWCANLWISFYGLGIESYTSGQLKTSGTPTPIDLSTFGNVPGIAFDKSNNLWAVINGGEVVRFTPAQLKKLKTDPDPTPGVSITSTLTFKVPAGCAFDHYGNLWVTDDENESIDELSKAQLDAGSENVTPAVVITSSDLHTPQFLTFDKAGNAWVENQGSYQIVEFSASQLTGSGSKSASVVLSSDGSSSLDDPGQIAFDHKGNLWVPNYSADTVVEFAKSQLASSGDPTPTVTLSSASFDGPWAVAFDSKGDLVAVNYIDGTIDKFTATQIKASGTPIPKVSVTGTAGNAQIIFGPAS